MSQVQIDYLERRVQELEERIVALEARTTLSEMTIYNMVTGLSREIEKKSVQAVIDARNRDPKL